MLCTSMIRYYTSRYTVVLPLPTEKSWHHIKHINLEGSVEWKWKACKSSLLSHPILLSFYIFLPVLPLISLPPVDLSSRNWRTKYQHYRSFWQFNFNAWLSVNLIIILSNHPINVFYIYNDHQVSSPFFHNLSRGEILEPRGTLTLFLCEAFLIEI